MAMLQAEGMAHLVHDGVEIVGAEECRRGIAVAAEEPVALAWSRRAHRTATDRRRGRCGASRR